MVKVKEINDIHSKVQKKNLLSLLPFQVIFLYREVKRVLHRETMLLQLLEEETELLLKKQLLTFDRRWEHQRGN